MQRSDALIIRPSLHVHWVDRVAVPVPRLREGGLLFAGALALYLGLGAYLNLIAHAIVGDAWSRVGNAYYMLFSRDPHLAAIGFVWNPLPSLLELPLVVLHGLWPPLVGAGFAGTIVSALAMAGAVYLVNATLADFRVPRGARLSLTVLFALHPMIVEYGANGDSEALWIFLLLVMVRALVGWLRDGETASLALAAVALGLGYLTRYEAGAVALATVPLVGLVTAARASGRPRWRLQAGLADGLIMGLPFVFAFLGWAAVSWLIVGEPFEQFTSPYGTASQLRTGPAVLPPGAASWQAPDFVAAQIAGLEPFALVLVALALVVGLWRRDVRVLAPLAIFGGVLLFAALLAIAGGTGGWLRFFITVVPLAALAAGVVLTIATDRAPGRPRLSMGGRWLGRSAIVPRVILTGSLLLLVGAGLPTAARTMFHTALGRGEQDQAAEVNTVLQGSQIAAYLDQRELAAGTVLLDTFVGFPIVLESATATQFVITPDRDFPQALSDPAAFGIRYVLVPQPEGLGTLDAVNRQWPSLYATGAGIGTLVAEFPASPGTHIWRLYAVSGVH